MRILIDNRVRSNIKEAGVWARSRPGAYFIFCVGDCRQQQQNFMMWAYAKNIGIKPLDGRYKSKHELAFIANKNDYEKLRVWFSSQETVLLLDQPNSSDQYRATLRYLGSGRTKALGRMVQVSQREAEDCGDYSYDPYLKNYFVCKNNQSIECGTSAFVTHFENVAAE